ncbi:MAG: hypothetical protein RR797_07265, partial [Christensenella sp.]
GNKCSGTVNFTQSTTGSIAQGLVVGGFVGAASDAIGIRNNISTSVITFGAPSYAAGNTKVGGFAGENILPVATYSGNYYLGNVGANGYFKDQVALRVGSGSNPNITSDAQIKRGAPPIITNAAQNPATWAASKTVSATVVMTAGQSATVDRVFCSMDAAAQTGTAMTAVGDVYTSSALTQSGNYYIIAYDSAGNKTVSSAVLVDKIDTVVPTITSVT